jgi:hypothetical protein
VSIGVVLAMAYTSRQAPVGFSVESARLVEPLTEPSNRSPSVAAPSLSATTATTATAFTAPTASELTSAGVFSQPTAAQRKAAPVATTVARARAGEATSAGVVSLPTSAHLTAAPVAQTASGATTVPSVPPSMPPPPTAAPGLVAVDDVMSLEVGKAIKVRVLANDHSSADDPLDAATLQIVTFPVHSEHVAVKDGQVSYTPVKGYSGPDSFTYSVCTRVGACATAQVSLNVTSNGAR